MAYKRYERPRRFVAHSPGRSLEMLPIIISRHGDVAVPVRHGTAKFVLRWAPHYVIVSTSILRQLGLGASWPLWCYG